LPQPVSFFPFRQESPLLGKFKWIEKTKEIHFSGFGIFFAVSYRKDLMRSFEEGSVRLFHLL
jgi:hypothetical protein